MKYRLGQGAVTGMLEKDTILPEDVDLRNDAGTTCLIEISAWCVEMMMMMMFTRREALSLPILPVLVVAFPSKSGEATAEGQHSVL